MTTNYPPQKFLKKLGLKMGLDLEYFIGNGFWMLSRQIVVSVCGLITLSIFSRYVNQEVFGQYQLILSILSMVMIFSLPGMSVSLVQAVAQGKDGFYREAFRLSLKASFIGSLVLFIVGTYFWFWRSELNFGLAIIIASLFFSFLSTFGLWESFFQGRERFDLSARYASLLALLQMMAVCGAIFFFPDQLIVLVFGYIFSITLANTLFYVSSKKLVRNNDSDEQSITFGFFMTRMSALGLIAEQIDKVLVGILLGPIQLAIYTIISFFGVRIKDAIRSFSSMLVPKMTLEKNSFSKILVLHKRTLLLMLAVIFLAGIIFYFAVEYMNSLLFSSTYETYFHLSRWYIITVILSVPLTIMGYYLYAKKNTYALTLSNTLFHVMRIVLNVFCIYFFGLIGAVAAYNISMILLLGVYVWGIYHEEGYFFATIK